MAAVWRESSNSSNQGGECVEVAALTNAIGVRDSRKPEGGQLILAPEAFARLVQRIKGLD